AAPAEVRHEVRQAGVLLIVVGVIGAIAGVLAIVYPDVTLLALALIAGMNLMLLGALGLVDAFSSDGDSTTRVLSAVHGLLGIVFLIRGVICIVRGVQVRKAVTA